VRRPTGNKRHINLLNLHIKLTTHFLLSSKKGLIQFSPSLLYVRIFLAQFPGKKKLLIFPYLAARLKEKNYYELQKLLGSLHGG
jgi:hypothetical protein